MKLQKKEKLLIVDDSRFQRVVFREMLAEKFEILEAVDGKECLEIIKKNGNNIDIVLLDLVMPNICLLYTSFSNIAYSFSRLLLSVVSIELKSSFFTTFPPPITLPTKNNPVPKNRHKIPAIKDIFINFFIIFSPF